MNEKEKSEVAKAVLAVVEFVDDMIPIVGKIMDLEIVDELESRLVDEIVESILNVDSESSSSNLLKEDPVPWSA